ncbi:hypothetical protein HOE07_04335, partial [archaeon]|nr:hypothetical protein [archaeon]
VDIALMGGYLSSTGCPATASGNFKLESSGPINVSEYENNLYFACQDCNGNNNTENYPFTLFGTDPLLIDNVYPNGETLYTDYTTLSVETSVGAEAGKSVCKYSGIEFLNTNLSTHSQPLESLTQGEYIYEIECYDVAGNINKSSITFTVDSDIAGPQLVSLYSDGTSMFLTMDEEVTCEYWNEEFSYGSGTPIISGATSGSFTLLGNNDAYYIICEDVFGNQGEFVVGTDFLEGQTL